MPSLPEPGSDPNPPRPAGGVDSPPPVVVHHTEVVVPARGDGWYDKLPRFWQAFMQLGFAGVVAALFTAMVLFGFSQVRDAGAERDRQNATILRLIDLNHETQDRSARETQAVRDNANRRHEQLLAEMAEWRRDIRDIAVNTRDTQKAVVALVESLRHDHDGLSKKIDGLLRALKARPADPDGDAVPIFGRWPRPERAPPPRESGEQEVM
jgi:hypothetical protein